MKGIMYKAERLAAEESVVAGHGKFNPEESILCVCLQHHRQISSSNEQVHCNITYVTSNMSKKQAFPGGLYCQ